MKKNKTKESEGKGGAILDGIMKVTSVSTIHTEVYVNDTTWKLLLQKKTSIPGGT